MVIGFRPSVWDPTLIVGQIICIQSTFYASESILLSTSSFFGYMVSLRDIFSAQAILSFIFFFINMNINALNRHRFGYI